MGRVVEGLKVEGLLELRPGGDKAVEGSLPAVCLCVCG